MTASARARRSVPRLPGAGVPIERVSQDLEHSNIAITYRIYARYLPDHMPDAAEAVNLDLGRISEAKVQ